MTYNDISDSLNSGFTTSSNGLSTERKRFFRDIESDILANYSGDFDRFESNYRGIFR
jgi:hypothetical protein